MASIAKRVGTIFITGITASGKSTLGKRLKDDLVKIGMDNVKLLDGEEVRKQLAKRGKRYGYSIRERNKVAMEISHMVLEYTLEGITCIVCGIAHEKEIRKKMRSIMGNTLEVYLDCPVNTCAQRDYKGHYTKAFKGLYNTFIGVTEPYQVSNSVELILHTGKDTIEKCASILFEKTKNFLAIEKNNIKTGRIL